MAKVIWKGHINFGLVDVPVRLYSATERHKLDFHLIDRRDQNPVGYVKINKETGREVRPDEIARAIEVDDEMVVVEDEDFERANPAATRSIDIEHFVRRDQIDPIFFEKPYYLAPQQGAERSYALLREVIRRTGRVGIAKFVLRRREHLAAVMVHEEVLTVELLRFSRDVRDPTELDVPGEALDELGITTDALEMATELVERMTRDWQPQQYRDEYYQQLTELIERRARQGAGAEQPSPPQPERPREPTSEELFEQLKRSIQQGR